MNYKNIIVLILLLVPAVSLAQTEYLVGIPGLPDPSTDLDKYINILYALSISIAAFLAVIKIIIAGVKWMLTDIVTSKEEAKNDIWGSTLGLLIVISAVLIFDTINPQITTTSLFIAPVSNPTINQTTNQTSDKPTSQMSGGDIATSMPNTAESQQLCEDEGYGGKWYSEGPGHENGWCIVNAGVNQTISCDPLGQVTQDNADGVEETFPGYDCSGAKEDCEDLGGEVGDSTSFFEDVDYEYEIQCNFSNSDTTS